jgi:hypothetical protein
MHKESAKLISELAAKYPKQTLVALWSDLRALKKADLEKLLAATSAKKRSSAKKAVKRQETAFDDTPASRIQHLLLKEAAMDAPVAADQLKRQLLQQGVASPRIPPLGASPFGDWLAALFRNVPASQVMHAALEISRKPIR